jgi:hypothetical protein
MRQAKRSGGPKTVQGKARSSKNTTSHGLTSLAPSNSNEKALVDSHSQELTDYYKPESPLELLQIRRIAMCRAKLDYLYDLEQVKLALVAKELESQPEKIFGEDPWSYWFGDGDGQGVHYEWSDSFTVSLGSALVGGDLRRNQANVRGD